jgi:hypothetical protein
MHTYKRNIARHGSTRMEEWIPRGVRGGAESDNAPVTRSERQLPTLSDGDGLRSGRAPTSKQKAAD